jgi:hypothetical protein
VEFGQGRARRVHQLKSLAQGESLKVVEYLGGRTVQRKAQKKTESLRSSVELCQEGIEQMHGLH